jgi:hypothetical protein
VHGRGFDLTWVEVDTWPLEAIQALDRLGMDERPEGGRMLLV